MRNQSSVLLVAALYGEHFLTHGLKNTGNKSINGAARGLKNLGIGTDYLMAVIYITWNSANKLASQLAPKIGKIALWLGTHSTEKQICGT